MTVAPPAVLGGETPELAAEAQRPATGAACRSRPRSGAVLLGFFVLAAIIGPLVSPVRPVLPEPGAQPVAARAGRRAPARHHAERPGRAVPAPGRHPADPGAGDHRRRGRHRAGGDRRRDRGVPRRPLGRGAVAGHQRVPGHPVAAAADPAARLPAAEGPDGHDPRAQRARLAVGRAGDPGPDAGHPQPRLRRRRPRDRREHLADHRVRDRAERGQPDRGQLREHRAVRDRRLGGAGLHRPGRPDQLEPRHDALLGAEPAGTAARRLVVVRAARPRGRAHGHRAGAAEHRHRRARQPAAARREPAPARSAGGGSGQPTRPRCCTRPRPPAAGSAASRTRSPAAPCSTTATALRAGRPGDREVSDEPRRARARHQGLLGRLPHARRRRPRGGPGEPRRCTPARSSAWPARAARASPRSPTGPAACCGRRR